MNEDNNQEDFRTYLRELRTDQIKTQLTLGQIILPEDRALAELELERRQAESELAQARQELEDFRRQLHKSNTMKWAAIASAWAAVLVMASIMLLG